MFFFVLFSVASVVSVVSVVSLLCSVFWKLFNLEQTPPQREREREREMEEKNKQTNVILDQLDSLIVVLVSIFFFFFSFYVFVILCFHYFERRGGAVNDQNILTLFSKLLSFKIEFEKVGKSLCLWGFLCPFASTFKDGDTRVICYFVLLK